MADQQTDVILWKCMLTEAGCEDGAGQQQLACVPLLGLLALSWTLVSHTCTSGRCHLLLANASAVIDSKCSVTYLPVTGDLHDLCLTPWLLTRKLKTLLLFLM